MDISFWKYLLPHGKLAALRQPIPEVAVFRGTELEACYCSGLQGSPQYQSSTSESRDLLLDRFLALAAFATGQHSFSGRSPAAILRQAGAQVPANSISKDPGMRSEVLSVAQLRLLLASPEKQSGAFTTSAQWSLQAIVAPAQDLMIVAEYLCDSFGTEHIDVTGSSYQASYNLCGENGIRFMHAQEGPPCESTEEVPEHQSREARANLLALVLHANSILQCCIKHVRVEFLVDRSGHTILHAFLDVALFEKGYPLYLPKSVASRCDGASHCVYSLWPSDIPTPTRSCQLASRTDNLSFSLCTPRPDPQSACSSLDEIEPDKSIEVTGKFSETTVLQNEWNVLSDAEQHFNDTACLESSGEPVSASGSRKRKLKKGRQATQSRTSRRPVKPPALPPSMPPLPIANPPANGSLSARLQIERHQFQQHVDHTLCLPASTCPRALSARARLESEPIARPKGDIAAFLGRDIGVLEAIPAPIALQRPGVAPLEHEPEEQYPLPQDDKARCIICTLPIPCQHTDAQREAFARHLSGLPRAVPPASKPLALLDHKTASTKACKSGLKCPPVAPRRHLPCDPGCKDAQESHRRSHSAHALLKTTWVDSTAQTKKTNLSCRPTLATLVGRTSLNEKQK